jgi:hypothetical protein
MVRGSYLLLLGLTAGFYFQGDTAHARLSEAPIPSFAANLLRVPQGLFLLHHVMPDPLRENTAAPGTPVQSDDRSEAKSNPDDDADKSSRDGQASVPDESPQPDSPSQAHVLEAAGEPTALVVHTDYKKAMTEAAQSRKLMFIYFHDPRMTAARRAFEELTLAGLEIQEKLKRYVVVKLPADTRITIDGKPQKLLSHPAFAEMLGRPGVAVIDLAHERAEYYGHVVSTFPFTPGKYYRQQAMSIILDLPPGTLTQRTMIYAVRIHPESPASTQGQFSNVLADEAKSHAYYQASIQVQGHHSWDTRFHRINSKLSNKVLAQEVVAESWPNESLVEACVDCVHSWRQSPGHWGAVRGRHPLFGYDIKRGRNGIWYATGIFGLRRR